MSKAPDKPAETFDTGQNQLLTRPITPSQLSEIFSMLLAEGAPHPADPSIMLWSAPGLGKTSILNQVCHAAGAALFEWRLATLNLLELIGLQYVDKDQGVTKWARTPLVPPPDLEGPCVVFADELTSAPSANQAEAYQVFRERRVGPHRLPPGCFTIAAGNRMSDRGVFYQMPKALVNRFRHYELVPALDDWLGWMLREGLLEPEVHAYLRTNPGRLFMMDLDSKPLPFASPRSWTYACRSIRRWSARHPTKRAQALAAARTDIEGEVGTAAATDFYAYLRYFQHVPDIPALMAGVITPAPPAAHQPDVLWAIISALVAYVPKTADLTPFLRYVTQLPGNYAVWAVLDALRAGGDTKARLMASPLFPSFASRYQDVITSLAA